MHHWKPRYTSISLAVLLIALFSALIIVQNQSAAQAAPPEVWVDYDVHERHIILVKLAEKTAVSTNGLSADPKLPAGSWDAVFDTPAATLDKWHNTASEGGASEDIPNLNLFYHVTLPDGVEAKEAIPEFWESPLVEGAYPVDLPVAPPLPPDYETSNAGNFDVQSNTNIYQRYLDSAANGGMDVRYAWEGTGGRGSGIDICDVEYGFNEHNDLSGVILLAVPYRGYSSSYYEHGTAVLGMLGSLDNGWGTTGMVTDARLLFSPVRAVTGSFNIANAITRCISNLNAGDVILIEQQSVGRAGNYVPVEWDPAVYAAIKTAVSQGITVVEAAGNGGEDLDHSFYQTAKPGHTPFTAAKDSGAIIVGSANSIWTTAPRSWNTDSSTYGSTVDLQGWGMHIIAPGYGNYYDAEGDKLSYTLFSGTSGASPMVTAAVAIVQANYIAKDSSPASPAQVKQLLQNTGTPQANEGDEHIGPFPNLRGAINQIWNLPEPAAPVVTPNSGAYTMPMQVSIAYGNAAQNSSNTHIRYTLDGSEPTIDSFIYIPESGHTIHLLYGATVRAKAFSGNSIANRFVESNTSTASYLSTTPKAAAPQITPNGGTHAQGNSIVMSTSTAGATIRYRTDGRAPSFFYPGTVYNGPVTLPAGTYNIVARAYKDGYYKSDATYANELTITPVTLPTPTIYPDSGSFAGETIVYIGSTVLGAQVRYTLDGSTPTISSPLYTDPIPLTSSATVKARVYLSGYAPSNVASKSYTIIGQAATPTFSPISGSTATNSMQVSLSTSTPNAVIRYTTNGAIPTSYSTLYTGSFTLGVGQHTVMARAFLPGATPSEVSTATYTVFDNSVSIATPQIDPPGGNFNGPITVTFSVDTENVTLFSYTLDGTDPYTSPSVQPYNGPFQLNGDATYYIRVRAYKSGVGNSEMAAATVVVVNPTLGTVQTPTISPPGGVFTNSVAVRIQSPDYNPPFNVRRLYVTTDGTDPVAEFDTPGSGFNGTYNFTVSSNQTVKAISAQAAWFDSAIAEAEFTFVCDTPTITDGGTFTNSKTVSINSGTTGAMIYYTTDGSTPTTSDSVYNGSFAVTSDTVVKAMCRKSGYEQSETAVSVFVIQQPAVAPGISSQLSNRSVASCGSASFSVSVTGSAPHTFTWFKDGSIIGGADEPVLSLDAVQAGDAGSYHVVVENEAGSVTSNTAVLTVTGNDTSCQVEPGYYIYIPMIVR